MQAKLIPLLLFGLLEISTARATPYNYELFRKKAKKMATIVGILQVQSCTPPKGASGICRIQGKWIQLDRTVEKGPKKEEEVTFEIYCASRKAPHSSGSPVHVVTEELLKAKQLKVYGQWKKEMNRKGKKAGKKRFSVLMDHVYVHKKKR